jgi:hypothetical protein
VPPSIAPLLAAPVLLLGATVPRVSRLLADAAPPSTDPTSVKVALIGFAGLVVSSLSVGGFALARDYLRTRATPGVLPHPEDRRTNRVLEIEWDAAHCENEAREARKTIARQAERIHSLERFLYRHRFDPAKISTGEEPDEAAHF